MQDGRCMELENVSEKILIYGAQSIALGVCRAVESLFPEKKILGFLVSERKGNPEILHRLPVLEISDCEGELWSRKIEKDEVTILIGTPETAHPEIIRVLERHGFVRYVCVDWKLEESMMEQYYIQNQKFPSLHALKCSYPDEVSVQDSLRVFLIKSHKDSELKEKWIGENWMHTLQAGASQTNLRIAEYVDNTGDNISAKNSNYCELTALYWIWKNLLNHQEEPDKYYGMFQYRRLLHIAHNDAVRLLENRPDVVLPFPTVHEPDIREHHTRYLREEDWNAMMQALEELHPDYTETFQRVLRQPYLYNYNILAAKAEVLKEYCAWLFPILERTEELSSPKGWERDDRYIGYLGENLLTLYFMYHADRLCIVHTGRVMRV